jgi:hypothetical protein
MIPDKRIAEVASRLTGIPTAELMQGNISERPRLVPMDSLEAFASIMELEAEFDKETVEWALRFIDALAARPDPAPGTTGPDGAHPLWDRELDG